MSTRSAIITKTATGDYLGIYCHNDGYPEGVGATLKEYYTTPEQVDDLITLGDISSLGDISVPEGKSHSYDNPEEGVTVAYCRDRGEKLRVTRGKTWQEVASRIDHQYAYVFANNIWEMHEN